MSHESDQQAEPGRQRKHYSGQIIPGQPPGAGLCCPACGCRHFRVLYTRPGLRGAVRRRRECRHCGRRISTVEVASGDGSGDSLIRISGDASSAQSDDTPSEGADNGGQTEAD